MSAWQISREQWVAWIEAGVGPSARDPAGPLDEIDAQLQDQLARSPFPTADEETVSRPGLSGPPDAFESMTTMVRNAVDDEDDDDATRVRRDPGALEVSLGAPEDGLEVSLYAAGEAPPELPAVAGETVVMEAPLPQGPYGRARSDAADRPPAHDEAAGVRDEGGWRDAEPPGPHEPTADEAFDDGLFIPALTRTVIAPVPIPMSDEPPPDELPPVVSGQTVIGPPPGPPPAPPLQGPPPLAAAEQETSTSRTSGFITSDPEEDAAQTLIRGEIPERDDVPEAAVPRKSKVVVDPSASGVLSAVYDDDEEPEEAAVEVEPDEPDEPDELDAEDLVEEEPQEPDAFAGGRSPAAPEALPPPAPAPSMRPPPARESDVPVARMARPSVEVGPPPPPLPSAALDAALAALPAAPPLDDGWQVDAFGDHFGALVSPLRAAAAAAEVAFIVHCAGLHPGASVLDVGCGDGAHCVGLAGRGLVTTGLDASPIPLTRASQGAQAHGVALELVAGDMRQPPVEGPFDAIVCIGSTLGMYTDEDDRIALQHMRDRLVPGGRLMLHVLNRDYIVARLPARSWWQGQGCLILDEAQMFAPTSRVHVHRTVVFETGKQFEHNIGLRLYGLTELVQMCAHVGLRVLEYSGSRHTRGRFYGATSSEIWLLAQRGE